MRVRWLRAVLALSTAGVLACGRTELWTDEPPVVEVPADGGVAGAVGGSGAGNAGSGGVAGLGGAAGVSGLGGHGGSDVGPPCSSGTLTWSCGPALRVGVCCRSLGGDEPVCVEYCPLDEDPNGLPCEDQGATTSARVVVGNSPDCRPFTAACHARSCVCSCRDEPNTVPDVATGCDETLLSSGQKYPTGLAVDDEFVYWATAGRCPTLEPTGTGTLTRARRRDGSGAITIRNLPCPLRVTVIGEDLYWSNAPGASGGSIWTARRTGEDARALAEDRGYPSTIRADAQHVYWFEDNHRIHRLGRTLSGTPELFATIESTASTNPVSAFVMDERYVYWADSKLGRGGGIFRADKQGGAAERVAEATDPREIALSSAGLFWIEEPGFLTPTLSMLRFGDSQPSRVTLSTYPMSLTAFGEHAYWVDGADGIGPNAVWTARMGVSMPSVMLAEQAGPRVIVADREHLFWVNVNYGEASGLNGEIRRACRE